MRSEDFIIDGEIHSLFFLRYLRDQVAATDGRHVFLQCDELLAASPSENRAQEAET